MSQSTLQISFAEIATEIARFLGLDRTKANWSASEVLDIAAIIKQGLRQFYFPPRVTANDPAHLWNFLRPQATLSIWDDVVAADAKLVSTAVYASPVTTITASAAVFYPSMEEKNLTFASGNTYVIDEYVSSTVVKVTGNAAAEVGNTILIDSGDTFTMPWDYGGMAADRFTFNVNDNRLTSIRLTVDSKIRLLRQTTISSGTPYIAAIVPLSTGGTQAQRWAALFHPPPNDIFSLSYRYYILPDALVDTTKEYPYGSASHSQTILESCLAAAESREQDDASTQHAAKFAALLQSSIDRDNLVGEAVDNYGYNADHSDEMDDLSIHRHYNIVSYNGVFY